MNLYIQEIQQTLRIRNMKTIPRHIVIKIFKINDNEKHLKSSQRGNITVYAEGKQKEEWAQISYGKQCKPQDGGSTSLKYRKKKKIWQARIQKQTNKKSFKKES